MVKMSPSEVKALADQHFEERNVWPKVTYIPKNTKLGNADMLRAEGIIARIYWDDHGHFSDIYEQDLI